MTPVALLRVTGRRTLSTLNAFGARSVVDKDGALSVVTTSRAGDRWALEADGRAPGLRD
ncbi:hypothetical protein [Actinotalea sp. Marseille-Q4924]|uniref:hypothetical protein n=1 Tax=Actinotalea sp. Marseille-Q4924 TaxID=2866571 RepID=UPI001CE42C89|nr:hypothetical protein [Actinotalea sp. Marseille-Q4924]